MDYKQTTTTTNRTTTADRSQHTRRISSPDDDVDDEDEIGRLQIRVSVCVPVLGEHIVEQTNSQVSYAGQIERDRRTISLAGRRELNQSTRLIENTSVRFVQFALRPVVVVVIGGRTVAFADVVVVLVVVVVPTR